MKKTISSIIRVQDSDLKMKLGTMNKKNPEVIYYECGLYIKPINNKLSYKEDILNIENDLKNKVKKDIQENKLFKSKYMFFVNAADERMKFNKKTFLTIQLYIKPSDELLQKYNGFKKLGKYILDGYKGLPNIKETVESYGFVTSKTKK